MPMHDDNVFLQAEVRKPRTSAKKTETILIFKDESRAAGYPSTAAQLQLDTNQTIGP